MHDIEELQRQFQAATDRRVAAEKAEREARQRLQDARNEASGLLGHLVEYDRTSWRGPAKTYRFVVKDVVGTGDYARAKGPGVLKNGSIGTVTRDCYLNKLRDLGPYKAPDALASSSEEGRTGE